MIDFAAHYRLDEFKAYCTAAASFHQARKDAAASDRWFDRLQLLDRRIGEFLLAKAQAGELPLIEHIEGRGLRWGDAWNRLVQHEDPEAAARVSSGMGLGLASMATARQPAQSSDEAYQALLKLVNQGELVQPSSAYGDCARTGQTLFVEFSSGWQPSYGLLNDKGREFVPLAQGLGAREVRAVQVRAPSGELLAADWFRIPEFTELTRLCPNDLNSEEGCAKKSEHYARFGLISTIVGNSCPTVLVQDGRILVASVDEDDGALRGDVRGSICTDLWWASFIDRQVLTELVASKIGDEAAHAAVQQLLDDKRVDVVQVPPNSTLYVHHNNDRGLLDEFANSDIDGCGIQRLFSVISTTPMEWSAVPKPASSPRP